MEKKFLIPLAYARGSLSASAITNRDVTNRDITSRDITSRDREGAVGLFQQKSRCQKGTWILTTRT